MTVNERVKYLRKNVLHLSQSDFAASIGLKQTGVSYMERDGSSVTDQTIKAICLIYNINEEWIRDGTGSIYAQEESFSLDQFCREHGATDFEIEVLKTYFSLDPEIRQTATEHFKKSLGRFFEPSIPDTPEDFEKKYPPEEIEKENGGSVG